MRIIRLTPVLLLFVLVTRGYAQPEQDVEVDSVSPSEAPQRIETEQVRQSVAIPVVAPLYISFQGYLEDNNVPANGSYDFVFRLRDFPTAGLTKWTETQNNVQVANGVYNVLLGSNNSLASVDFNDELWLMIEVEGQEILPRPQISASPYSIMALEALDLRLPAEISGTANVDGTKLLTITNNGTGDVLEITGDFASDGIEVRDVDLNGVEVLFVGQSAFLASGPGGDGLNVQGPGDDGVDVSNAGDNGIVVIEAGSHAFVFRDNPSSTNGNNLSAYVGYVENTGTSSSEDVLALKTGYTNPDPDLGPATAVNFIGFFDGSNDLMGQIEGNGTRGVAYNTSGSDYAEYLSHLEPGEDFEAGDVVGVFGGKITRRTEGAQEVMAITDRAAVLGNAPLNDEGTSGYESVSFIGQLPIRVSGPVRAGDYLVSSGMDDGTAIAISPSAVTLSHVDQLVGRAWESSEATGVRRVNAVVGLDRSEVLAEIVKRQAAELDAQRQALDEIRTLLSELVQGRQGS